MHDQQRNNHAKISRREGFSSLQTKKQSTQTLAKKVDKFRPENFGIIPKIGMKMLKNAKNGMRVKKFEIK